MAAWTSTEQHREIGTSEETSALDGMDVRFVCDTGRSMNNAHDYALAGKLAFGAIGAPLVDGPAAGVTDEMLVLFLGGPWYLPDGYNYVRCWLNTERTAKADDASETIWKVVLAASPLYNGDEVYDDNLLRVEKTQTFSTRSDDRVISTGLVSVAQLNNRLVWGYLTAQNQDASVASRLWSIDLQEQVA